MDKKQKQQELNERRDEAIRNAESIYNFARVAFEKLNQSKSTAKQRAKARRAMLQALERVNCIKTQYSHLIAACNIDYAETNYIRTA